MKDNKLSQLMNVSGVSVLMIMNKQILHSDEKKITWSDCLDLYFTSPVKFKSNQLHVTKHVSFQIHTDHCQHLAKLIKLNNVHLTMLDKAH